MKRFGALLIVLAAAGVMPVAPQAAPVAPQAAPVVPPVVPRAAVVHPCESRGVPHRATIAAAASRIDAVNAGQDRHAGVIVETPQATRQFCVAFTAAEESAGFDGIELLRRTGLDVVLGGTRDLASVCRIGQTGCSDPGQCFCQCRDARDDACRFWGYYTLDASSAWTFAQASPSLRRVRDGDVDGWRFGNHAGGAGAPPAIPTMRCVNSSRPVAAAGSSSPARRSPALGWIAAAVVAAAFAGGVVWSLRGRKDEQ